MNIKDFFGGLFFIGIAGYFVFLLIESMPSLFIDSTTIWQYCKALFRVAMIIFLFNLGLTLMKKFFTTKRAA